MGGAEHIKGDPIHWGTVFTTTVNTVSATTSKAFSLMQGSVKNMSGPRLVAKSLLPEIIIIWLINLPQKVILMLDYTYRKCQVA